MTTIDIESILNDIQKKISDNKKNYENLLDFIITELSKSQTTVDDHILESLANNINSKYYTKEETKNFLREKFNQVQKIHSFDKNIQEQNSIHYFNHNDATNLIDKQILNSITKNKNLFDTSDQTLHFSKRHMSFLSKIFYLQITQNYLNALKWYFTSELVEKQTKFNSALDDGIKNLITTIHNIERNHEISINELKNYANKSTNWIQNIESKLEQTSKTNQRITAIESKLEQTSKTNQRITAIESKLEQTSKTNQRITAIESKLIENFNELKELVITRDMKTTDFLLSKISKLESSLEDIRKSTEIKNETK